MRGWIVLLGACTALAPRSPRHDPATHFVTSDASALAGMLVAPVELGGLWFADPDCRREFSAAKRVEEDQLRMLARCLASLHLERGLRSSSFPEVATLVYPPGIELEVAYIHDDEDSTRIRWIGYTGSGTASQALPTVTQAALEAHRRGSDMLDRGRLDRERAERKTRDAFAWLRVCVDTAGVVTSVSPRLASSVVAQRVFVDAARRWTFEPVRLGGQPQPVCAMMLVGYPRVPMDRGLPFPIPEREAALPVVPYEALGPLTNGNPDPYMPYGAWKYVVVHRIPEVKTPVLVCIDETGTVDDVALLRSSGFRAYDLNILEAMHGWRFAPYVVDDQPLRVCATRLLVVANTCLGEVGRPWRCQ